ncbi:hypothetical protein HY489_04115 [Candidatus Woesearchaeota archaeon]|nr:hypothetical protein [Candidatus Woesearchaeota archaeon]
MKKAAITIFIILLAGAALYQGMNKYQNERIIKSCVTKQTDTQKLLTALKTNNPSLCAELTQPHASRCKAYLSNEPTNCQQNDLDCQAIASKKPEQCAESLCKAWATQNPEMCNELGNSAQWCKNLVTLNAEAFTPKREECEKITRY